MVGGCIGTDAHTVGIDAILNVKGFAGEKGLEYYRELKVVNLGAQVSVPQLVERAREEKADAILVSQVVTQRDAHIFNTKEMSAAFREAYPRDRRPLLIVGGPRFDETMAAELGVDRVFARGTTPGEVASYLVAASWSPDAERGRPHERRPASGCGDPPPLRALLARPLRRQPRRRRLLAGLFGDVATEVCIRTDGDEGLFASYSDVQFRAPVRAGDVLEVTAEVVRGRPALAHARASQRPSCRRGRRTSPRRPRRCSPSRSWPPRRRASWSSPPPTSPEPTSVTWRVATRHAASREKQSELPATGDPD